MHQNGARLPDKSMFPAKIEARYWQQPCLSESAMLRLLIVDRSPSLFHAIRPLADELQFEMVLCESLADAFAELPRFQPHIAVVDPDLGEIGTVGAVRGIRALAPVCE